MPGGWSVERRLLLLPVAAAGDVQSGRSGAGVGPRGQLPVGPHLDPAAGSGRRRADPGQPGKSS